MWIARVLLAGVLALIAAGCSQYKEPPKDSRSYSLLTAGGVSIERVDGQRVVGASVRVFPGSRSVELSRTDSSASRYGYVVSHWRIIYPFQEGTAYRFAAQGRDLLITNVNEGKTYRFTGGTGLVPVTGPDTRPSAVSPDLAGGRVARLISASASGVGSNYCNVDARIELRGYPHVPFTLRGTIVNQGGQTVYPEHPQQFARKVETGDDEDTDTYHLPIPWGQVAGLARPAFVKLELLDSSGTVVSTLADNVDLFTDMRPAPYP